MNIIEQTQNGVPFLQSDGFNAAGGLTHGFSTRLGGVSEGMWESLNLGVSRGDDPDHVRENYRRFLSAIGARGACIATCNQVHGAVVRNITSADVKTDPYEKLAFDADGLMTAIPGVILAVFTADCIPVLLYDPRRRVAAALHAGWRGTAAGIVTVAVGQMTSTYGTDPADILAAIGPGIGPCCFETHDDVPDAMRSAFGGGAETYIEPRGEKWTVDLKGVNAWRLREAGVRGENIDVCPVCTACRTDLYWSHRITGNKRGLQGALIALAGEEGRG